jgi:hypothetical protein
MVQHPDFFLFDRGRWWYPDSDLIEYLPWYAAFYADALDGQILGEDSTTYLVSEKAPGRISKINPTAKIIIMLRNPASRTYSHYWHLVQTGRTMWSFEDSMQLDPGWGLIERSLYKIQIERFLSHMSRENIFFVLLEEFMSDTDAIFDAVCRFLKIRSEHVDVSLIDTHRNRARLSRSVRIQLWHNRLMRRRRRRMYAKHLPWMPSPTNPYSDYLMRSIDRIFRRLNPLREGQPPQMKEETRKFLNAFFRRENDGLSRLIQKDVGEWWYH